MITNEDVVKILDEYSEVKKHLSLRLVPGTYDPDIDAELVTKTIGDMKMYVVCELGEDDACRVSAMMTAERLNHYGITREQLFKDALESSEQLHPASCTCVDDLLGVEKPDELEPKFLMLSTPDGFKGAFTILYPSSQEWLEHILGPNYYIIPSSVHEVLLVPSNTIITREDYESIIRGINAEVLKGDDFLSNNLYQYDSANKRIVMAKDMEESV